MNNRNAAVRAPKTVEHHTKLWLAVVVVGKRRSSTGETVELTLERHAIHTVILYMCDFIEYCLCANCTAAWH